MKEFALSIDNQPFNLPAPIQTLDNNAGFLGAHFISVTITIIFVIAAIVALVFSVIGGYKWIMSSGDPKALGDARATIINSFIGLVIIFMSYIVINVIGQFFGIPLLGQ